MFRRFAIALSVAAILTLLALPVMAQDNWFVLLFDNMTKEFLRVNADGTQETYSLGLPEDQYVGARDMAFAPDGNQVAFCVLEYSETGQNSTTLYVRDLAAGTNVIERDLGSSIGCRVNGNEDNSQLAVVLVRYYSGDPNADTSQSAWELMVVDAATGETLNTLNASSPAASIMEYAYGETFLPYVFRFTGNQVVFGEVPYGSEFPPDIPTYTWQLDADTLEPEAQWGQLNSDYLDSTGEYVWLAYDPNLPVGEPMGPVTPNNLVNVRNANGETQVIYHSPDWILTNVAFINNGEQLALQLIEPFDPNSSEPPMGTRWIALDRAGNVTELLSAESYLELAGAPDGYVVFYAERSDIPATYVLDYHGDGGINRLATFESAQLGSWQLAYVSPATPAEGLSPFTAVNP